MQWKSKDGNQKDLNRTSSSGRAAWCAKNAATVDKQSDCVTVLKDLVATYPESQPVDNCADVLATRLRYQELPQQSAEQVADELGAVLRRMGWPLQPTELVHTSLRSQLVPQNDNSASDSGLVWVRQQSPKPSQHHSVSAWECEHKLQAPISSSEEPCKFMEESKFGLEASLKNHPVRETTTSENAMKARVSEQQGRSRRKNEGDRIWIKRPLPMLFQNRSAPEQEIIPEVREWEGNLSKPAPISSMEEPCRSTKGSKSGVEARLENHPDRVFAGSAGSMTAHISEQQRRSRRKNGGDRVRAPWQPTLGSSSGTSEILTRRVHPAGQHPLFERPRMKYA